MKYHIISRAILCFPCVKYVFLLHPWCVPAISIPYLCIIGTENKDQLSVLSCVCMPCMKSKATYLWIVHAQRSPHLMNDLPGTHTSICWHVLWRNFWTCFIWSSLTFSHRLFILFNAQFIMLLIRFNNASFLAVDELKYALNVTSDIPSWCTASTNRFFTW